MSNRSKGGCFIMRSVSGIVKQALRINVRSFGGGLPCSRRLAKILPKKTNSIRKSRFRIIKLMTTNYLVKLSVIL